MTEKLLTYALGRALEPSDMPAVRAIVRARRARRLRFSSLIDGVVQQRPVHDAPYGRRAVNQYGDTVRLSRTLGRSRRS